MMFVPVFLGSFLLFGIQPMLGRLLLPGFGGSAAVWSVCLAAYQVLLLAGYFYAHGLAGRARRTQWRWHSLALGAAAGWCVQAAWGWQHMRGRIGSSSLPSLEVLAHVVALIGLPYVVLASGTPLLQAWLARREGRGAYRLYAVSNLGSFLGLFCYPLVVEPFVPLAWQWRGFATGFGVYAVLVGALGWGVLNDSPDRMDQVGRGDQAGRAAVGLPRALAHPAWWFVLPGLSSFLLVAVTNHLTLDVTPVPLMWAGLLGVFLLSYVAGFSRAGEKGVDVWAFLAVAGLGGVAHVAGIRGGAGHRFVVALLGGGAGFGLVCVFLHSWLFVARPHEPRALTRFYLGVAGGGAVGGVLGALVCPVVLTAVWEWPVGVLLANACAGWFVWKRRYRDRCMDYFVKMALCCVPVWFVFNLHSSRLVEDGRVVKSLRSFYGTLSVIREDLTVEGERRQELFQFAHGRTRHGAQRIRYWEEDAAPTPAGQNAGNGEWEGFPLLKVVAKTYAEEPAPNTYFGPSGGGAGILSRLHARDEPLRVGLVGLGVGTMAAWGRPGDAYRFYEINPQVAEVALSDRWFTFLTGSKASVEIVVGDARKALEAEERAGFPKWDVLVVDAYSGDSIPLHLATREAFSLYRRRLAENGILCMHVTNWHIDLLPLVKRVSLETGMRLKGVASLAHGDYTTSVWALLSETDFDLVRGEQRGFEIDWDKVEAMPFLPGDQKGSLVSLMMWNNQEWNVPPKRPTGE